MIINIAVNFGFQFLVGYELPVEEAFRPDLSSDSDVFRFVESLLEILSYSHFYFHFTVFLS